MRSTSEPIEQLDPSRADFVTARGSHLTRAAREGHRRTKSFPVTVPQVRRRLRPEEGSQEGVSSTAHSPIEDANQRKSSGLGGSRRLQRVPPNIFRAGASPLWTAFPRTNGARPMFKEDRAVQLSGRVAGQRIEVGHGRAPRVQGWTSTQRLGRREPSLYFFVSEHSGQRNMVTSKRHVGGEPTEPALALTHQTFSDKGFLKNSLSTDSQLEKSTVRADKRRPSRRAEGVQASHEDQLQLSPRYREQPLPCPDHRCRSSHRGCSNEEPVRHRPDRCGARSRSSSTAAARPFPIKWQGLRHSTRSSSRRRDTPWTRSADQ